MKPKGKTLLLLLLLEGALGVSPAAGGPVSDCAVPQDPGPRGAVYDVAGFYQLSVDADASGARARFASSSSYSVVEAGPQGAHLYGRRAAPDLRHANVAFDVRSSPEPVVCVAATTLGVGLQVP